MVGGGRPWWKEEIDAWCHFAAPSGLFFGWHGSTYVLVCQVCVWGWTVGTRVRRVERRASSAGWSDLAATVLDAAGGLTRPGSCLGDRGPDCVR
jgi:hypothetical protein